MNIDETYYGLRAEVAKKIPALVELITSAAGSYEAKCHLCEDALRGDLTIANFKEKAGHMLPATHELSTHRDVKGQQLTEADKARRTFNKHNGATVFTESDTTKRDPFAKGDAALYKGLNLSEAQIRKLTNALPPEVAAMSESQQREYKFNRSIGLSESDSLAVLRITGGRPLHEVGR